MVRRRTKLLLNRGRDVLEGFGGFGVGVGEQTSLLAG